MAAPIKKILLLYTDKYYLINPVYPFGLDVLARHLASAGFDTTIGCPYLPHTDLQTNLMGLLQETQPDLIGLGLRNLDTTMSCEPFGNFTDTEYRALFFLPAVKDIVAIIKTLRPDIPLVLGGGAFTIAPDAILDYLEVDFGIVGEGEAPLIEFLHAYPDPAACHQIPNLVYKDAGTYRVNPRHHYTFRRYAPFTRRAPQFNYAYATAGIPVQTKRGCNQRCAYCVEPQIEGRKFIYRQPRDVISEIEVLADNYPDAKSIFFVDTEFNTPDLKHGTRILDQIVTRSLHQRFRFASQFLPRPFSSDLAESLRQAGFTIILTADSFADPVLARNGLAFRQTDIIKAIDLCETVGIDCTINLIFGLPGETQRTLDHTLNAVHQRPPNDLRRYEYTCGARIYPGTPLHQAIDGATRHPHVHGSPSDSFLQPCFYCEPMGPHSLNAYVDVRLPFALDFRNDYDTIAHQVLGLAYLTDLGLWNDVMAYFNTCALAAMANSYLYLVKKLAAAEQPRLARAILLNLVEKIELDDHTGQYVDTLPVARYYLSILSKF